MSSFARYSDRAKAEEVWRAYSPDIRRLGLYNQADYIRRQLSDSVALDTRLDLLLTQNETRNVSGRASPVDETEGFYSNRVRAREGN
jgi:hypothetical protein